MSKKQTAVEWLFNELVKKGLPIEKHGIDLYKQAKAMEREQQIKFAIHLHNVDCSKTGIDILLNEAEHYYNETYGKENSNAINV